jgi:hypothetical protein
VFAWSYSCERTDADAVGRFFDSCGAASHSAWVVRVGAFVDLVVVCDCCTEFGGLQICRIVAARGTCGSRRANGVVEWCGGDYEGDDDRFK